MGSRHLKRLALEKDLQAQNSSDVEEEDDDESPFQPKKNPFASLEAEEGSEEEEKAEETVQQEAASSSKQQKGRATPPTSKRSQKEEKRKKSGAKKEEEEDLDKLLQSMNISIVSCLQFLNQMPNRSQTWQCFESLQHTWCQAFVSLNITIDCMFWLQATQSVPEASTGPATSGVLVVQARKLKPEDELVGIFGKKFISSAVSQEENEGWFCGPSQQQGLPFKISTLE